MSCFSIPLVEPSRSGTLSIITMLSLLYLVGALGGTLAATQFAIRINNAQETVNLDTLVTVGSRVTFTCKDNASLNTGSILLVNDAATVLANASEGIWIINSMSLEDQGAYRCCVQSRCDDLAVISKFFALSLTRNCHASIPILLQFPHDNCALQLYVVSAYGAQTGLAARPVVYV